MLYDKYSSEPVGFDAHIDPKEPSPGRGCPVRTLGGCEEPYFSEKFSSELVSVTVSDMQPPNLPRHCETSPQTGRGNPHPICIITQYVPHE